MFNYCILFYFMFKSCSREQTRGTTPDDNLNNTRESFSLVEIHSPFPQIQPRQSSLHGNYKKNQKIEKTQDNVAEEILVELSEDSDHETFRKSSLDIEDKDSKDSTCCQKFSNVFCRCSGKNKEKDLNSLEEKKDKNLCCKALSLFAHFSCELILLVCRILD